MHHTNCWLCMLPWNPYWVISYKPLQKKTKTQHIQPKKNTITLSHQITEGPVKVQVECFTCFRRSGSHSDGGSVGFLGRRKGNLENQQCREAAKHVSPTSLDTSYTNFSVLVSQGKTFHQIINQLNWFDHEMMQRKRSSRLGGLPFVVFSLLHR